MDWICSTAGAKGLCRRSRGEGHDGHLHRGYVHFTLADAEVGGVAIEPMASDALKGRERWPGNLLTGLQASFFAEVKALTDANNGFGADAQSVANEIKITGMDEGLFENRKCREERYRGRAVRRQ